MERTRPCRPDGSTVTASPIRSRPDHAVPVTTVPTPARENDRSTGRRKRSVPLRGSSVSARAARRALSSSRPRPVRTDVATGASNATLDPASRSATSSSTRSSHSGSTRSALVTTGMPAAMPRCSRTARCSSVCGMIPSSAATTSSARSIPEAPATIVRTKSSWPGTSTIPATAPPGNASGAKLRSIVIPRRRSSASRSMGRPLNAATSADFPWSMCPAVPTIMPPPTGGEARTRGRGAPPPRPGGSARSAREVSVRGAMTLVERRQRRVRIE